MLFNLESRLRSFVGQYGGLTSDISHMLDPYMKSDGLVLSDTPDIEIGNIIRLIRSKLIHQVRVHLNLRSLHLLKVMNAKIYWKSGECLAKEWNI